MLHSEVSADAPLAGLWLLSELPAEVREVVERSFVRRDYAFGEVVVERGDPADALYVIAAGTARVLSIGEDGSEVPLKLLGPGESFGETAVLMGTARTATVRASTELTVLRLDGGLLRALAERYTAIAERLTDRSRTQKLSNLLRLHSIFADLPDAVTLALVEQFERVQLDDGAAAVHQDEPADAMFLVEDGQLGVWREPGGRGEPVRIRTLRSGQVFGEMALVTGEPRTATVRADGPARLRRLDAARFRALLDEQPSFAARVRERLALYALRDRRDAEAAADGGRRDLGTAAGQDDAWSAGAPGLAVSDDGRSDAEPERVAVPLPRRFPFVRQIDEMDCGAACLAMICRAFGHDVSMTSIRYAVGAGISGTSLRGLVRGGEELGLRMRSIKSSIDRLEQLPLPAIVHWKGEHWIVLFAVERDRVRVADPALGVRRISRSEFAEHWTGFAALAEPTERLAEAPRGGLSLGWFWPFLRPHRRALAVAAVLSLIGAAAEMVIPLFSQIIIDRVVRGHRESLLAVVALAMLGLVLIAVLVTIGERLLLARAAARLDGDTLEFLTQRLLRLPVRYFQTRRTGDIQRRIGGMRTVRMVLVGTGVTVLTAVTQLAIALAIMFSYSWQLGLLFLGCGPLYAGLMRYSAVKMRPMFDSVEEGSGRYQSRQIDAIRGIETVKALGAEDGLRRRMSQEFALLQDKLLRANVVSMIYAGLVSVVSYLIYGVFLVAGAYEVLHHHLTIGQLVAFTALVLLANGPLITMLGLWDQMQFLTVLLGRLQDVFDQTPEQGEDHSGLLAVPALAGGVRLRQVSFAYGNHPDRTILEDVSLDVSPGTTVALVGRSGSGKSTLVKCIAGLMVPTGGVIEYDGTPLEELDFADLRRRIGFVLQEPYIFDDTIEANIAFGEDRADGERVRRAAEIAAAADFIERLPLGYQTRVGDSGLRLSGGQAQRIAIARALYHEPPVLLFDEATSALDTEAERAVKQNMDRLLEGRTAFIVAHRLSTIRDADLICVLEQGRLVESGTHAELLRREGLYAYLHAQQLAD